MENGKIRRRLTESCILLARHAKERKVWFLPAALSVVLLVVLSVRPGGFLRGETENFLAGEGMWTETLSENPSGFCQEFVPRHSGLKSIGIYLETSAMLAGGY